MNEGACTTNHAARARICGEIFQRISNQADMPFLYAIPSYNIASKKAHGPGFSRPLYNAFAIGWPDVWLSR